MHLDDVLSELVADSGDRLLRVAAMRPLVTAASTEEGRA